MQLKRKWDNAVPMLCRISKFDPGVSVNHQITPATVFGSTTNEFLFVEKLRCLLTKESNGCISDVNIGVLEEDMSGFDATKEHRKPQSKYLSEPSLLCFFNYSGNLHYSLILTPLLCNAIFPLSIFPSILSLASPSSL
ncbi:hypothetical protein VNO80_00421 [Phaseolus coccineus]|uniref:Uncharacterized protein n=1 Tax=Phaseolus coccineus TaxID=3886 RepID=A0AAN9RR79_PHACN